MWIMYPITYIILILFIRENDIAIAIHFSYVGVSLYMCVCVFALKMRSLQCRQFEMANKPQAQFLLNMRDCDIGCTQCSVTMSSGRIVMATSALKKRP